MSCDHDASAHFPRWREHRRSQLSFSLLELLISVVLGTALVSAVFYVITGQIRGASKEELAQRTRDDATRLNHLIQTEASEAVTTTQGQTISNCAAAANGRTSLFALTIPRPTAQFDDLTNVTTIYYYSTTSSGITDLRRCGPAIQRNGSLDFSTMVDGIVSANTGLNLVTCNSTTSSSREVAYQLQLNDVSNGYSPPCAIARAKAFRVVDPTP
jgi:type II secretory pathway pseudopilin PulG